MHDSRFLARALFKPLVVAHPMFPATGMRGLATRVLCTGVRILPFSGSWARSPNIVNCDLNPHDDSVFKKWTAINDRKRDLVFVGRLIKEKGLQNVLLALDHLREKEILLSLMVVGSGPDAEWYKEESKKLGLNNQVTFVGAVSPAQIAEIYNVHKIAVVPSTWEEPFGIVALEGIACGCAVVGSISGGLPEAIGPCGLTYPKMSVGDLAARLEQLVLEPGFWRRCKSTRSSISPGIRGRPLLPSISAS